jgi:pyruvate dehydrogenase E2 component (dihydrolipoamide acetyltransferase)
MSVDELRRTRSSPVVRKIASEFGVDLRNVEGSGISGRVTKRDILTHLEGQAGAETIRMRSPFAETSSTLPPGSTAATIPPGAGAEPKSGIPAYRPGERIEVVPMSPIRRKTAEHMTASKRISAHVSTVWEVDMTRVDHLRRRYQPVYAERYQVKLTFLPFVLKATLDALKEHPVLNASVEGDSIVYKKDVNLGIAVALDWGLIVPVIHNADEKNLLGLARATNDLAERARAKKLKVDEIQGGTFTITNPGVFGSLFGTPIINQPQVAILGLGTIERRPVVRDDAIAIRTMAYFALTFDHRIVDGSDADKFMAHVKKSLQEFDEGSL